MPQVVKNIIDGSTTNILTGDSLYGSVINSLALCNSGNTPVTITLKKVFEAPHVAESYLLLNAVSLAVGKTLNYNGEFVSMGYVIRLIVSGGAVDLDMDYITLNAPRT